MLARPRLRTKPRGGSLSFVEVGAVFALFLTAAAGIANRAPLAVGCAMAQPPTMGAHALVTAQRPRKAGGAHAPPRGTATASANRPRVAAAVTTSKRPDLFRRAYFSFRTRCLDCDAVVDTWFAVDDGSPPEDLAAMQAATGDIVWLDKPASARGHVSSLNRVLAATADYDYLVFLEDDFFFVRDADYVWKALDIMSKNASIGQVVFNKLYSLTDTDAEERAHVGAVDVVDPATGAVDYMLHQYVGPAGSKAWSDYFAAHPGVGSVHWPHFSLNSGVWRLAALRDVGLFETRDAFEFFHGLRYMQRGYVTAFFPGRYSIHLGKPLPGSRLGSDVLDAMYSQHGLRHSVNATASAYDLNRVIR